MLTTALSLSPSSFLPLPSGSSAILLPDQKFPDAVGLSASRATFMGNGIARHAVLDAALSGLAHGFEREAIDGWLDDGRRTQALRMRTHGGVSSPPLMKFT